MLEEKAAKYFENEWVWEKELRQLQEQEETAIDVEVKRGLQYMIQVKVEALKLHFKRDDLPGLSKLLVAERMKPAMDMKWLSSQQAQQGYGGLCLICLMGTNLMSKTFSSRLIHHDVKGYEQPACAGMQFQEMASPHKYSRFKEEKNNPLFQVE